jgi:hypothetical protein
MGFYDFACANAIQKAVSYLENQKTFINIHSPF